VRKGISPPAKPMVVKAVSCWISRVYIDGFRIHQWSSQRAAIA